MSCEKCNLEPKKRTYKYIIVNDDTGKYCVVDQKENYEFSKASNTKGAVIGAMAIGIPLSQINFNGNYVPLREVFSVIN